MANAYGVEMARGEVKPMFWGTVSTRTRGRFRGRVGKRCVGGVTMLVVDTPRSDEMHERVYIPVGEVDLMEEETRQSFFRDTGLDSGEWPRDAFDDRTKADERDHLGYD